MQGQHLIEVRSRTAEDPHGVSEPASVGFGVDWEPPELHFQVDRPHDAPLISGGSLIVSPMGEVLAGPLRGGEGLVTAEVDLADIVRARFDFDAAGHYARSDLFGTDMFRLDVSGAAG